MALYLPMVRDSVDGPSPVLDKHSFLELLAVPGQTSSGKTHTMEAGIANINSVALAASAFCQGPDIEDEVQMGVIPRRLGSHVGDGIS